MSTNTADEVSRIRMKLKTDGRFRLELLARISQLAREHGVEVSDEVLRNLTLATTDELDLPLSGPPLPGGQNC